MLGVSHFYCYVFSVLFNVHTAISFCPIPSCSSVNPIFLPVPLPSPFTTAHSLAFFCYLQFCLNEFGLLEIITEVEAEAIKTLSASAVNASPASFAPAAINASAASSTDLEGELFAVEENIQFLKKLLETGLAEIRVSVAWCSLVQCVE